VKIKHILESNTKVILDFYFFQGNPSERVGVTDCEPCVNNPCQNAGTCQETFKPPGFICQCRNDFKGRTCDGYKKGCHAGACVNGRCVNLDDGGYKCVCTVGFTGPKCEQGKITKSKSIRNLFILEKIFITSFLESFDNLTLAWKR